MGRYKLTLEYDGTCFNGWQKQPGLPTVQETLEKAIQAFTQEEVEVYGSGRTDRGVHALGQVAHTDLSRDMAPYAVREAINHFVRDQGVIVLEVEKVPDTFHARFSAQQRIYFYKIIQRSPDLVIERHRAWHVYKPLNLDTVREAAIFLKGTHDFSSFRAGDCQAKSPIKTLDAIEIMPFHDLMSEEFQGFLFKVSAKSFLHHQVRNMVGALKMVGEGKWTPGDLKKALEAKDRDKGGVMAPAEGLYLASILY